MTEENKKLKNKMVTEDVTSESGEQAEGSTAPASGEQIEDLFITEETPQMMLSMDGRDIEVGHIEDLVVTETGANTDVKIFYPKMERKGDSGAAVSQQDLAGVEEYASWLDGVGEEAFPVMFFIHGGAFIGGFNFMDEPVCRQLCRDTHCAVISPNYQLAPAHQWPSALDELYALLRYFKANADRYHLNMAQLAVGGSSAGANLAAALSVKAWQEKDLHICYQSLIYPSIDLLVDEKTDYRLNDLTDSVAMPLQGVIDMVKQYVPEGEDCANPLISPIFAPAEAFPQTSIFSGREDIFWAEGRKLAEKLTDAGIETLYKCYPTGHGFMELAGREYISRDVRNLIASDLKRVFLRETH